MITCTTWSRILGHLGRFEAWVVLRLWRFVFWTFWSWDVLRLGTFWGLGHFEALDVLYIGRFGAGTFWSSDVLRLGPYVFGRSVFGRYVFGCFVCAPLKIVLNQQVFRLKPQAFKFTVSFQKPQVEYFTIFV
jgi:hypothetical protein